jgi:predicted lipoprotein with Yx(FWY)xxD motif
MRRTHAFRSAGAVALAAMLAFAACGGDDDDSASEPDPTEATTIGDPTTTSSAETAGDVAVAVGETDLGEVLVDAEGMTLYIFDQDTDGVSNCNEGCVESWPPLVVDGTEVAVDESLDAAAFTTIERSDGTRQVAVNGQPLYFYAADSAAGDTTGDGVGGIWHVVGPDGETLDGGGTDPASTTGTEAPTTGMNYGY